MERVRCVTFRRRLLTLQKRTDDSLALGPYEAKKGDLVCILNGCSVPVLLRMFVNGNPIKYNLNSPPQVDIDHDVVHYQFVGECYVHAMMDGEAWKTPLKERLPQDFYLR
jgi:hypothetical protein